MNVVETLKPLSEQPVPLVIEHLERALNLARSGELRSVVVVGDIRGDRYYATCGMENTVMLLGHLHLAINVITHTIPFEPD